MAYQCTPKQAEEIFDESHSVAMNIINGLIHPHSRECKDYYENHQCCPDCLSDGIEQTLSGGRIFGPLQDENRASCSGCGWTGIVDDLLPLEKTT